MRAICKVCKDKDSCSYIKCGREGDCIDVQTSDYGYEEAVEKAVEWLENAFNGDNIEGCKDSKQLIEEFKKEMEL